MSAIDGISGPPHDRRDVRRIRRLEETCPV
jgi:hypothetical protein